VASTLDGHNCLHDIQGPFTVPVLAQYLQIRQLLGSIVMTPRSPNRVTLPCHVCWPMLHVGGKRALESESTKKMPLHGLVGVAGLVLDLGAASKARSAT
jgi:hypothetical protein